MEPRRSKFVKNFYTIFALLASLFSSAVFTSQVQAAEENVLPVEQVLKSDGTLNLPAGYSGNLDFTNFEVSLNPVLGPTFKPLSTANAWSALGATPLSGNVQAIVINGSDMYVGGFFQNAGGVAEADFIAKFSGGSWSALGVTPLNNAVQAIAISGSDVYAGGFFSNAGGVAEADYIAKFSNGAWSALTATPVTGNVHALAINGSDVYVGGEFTDAGGVLQADNIAKISNGVLSAVGGTNLGGIVRAIVISGSDLYAGGSFINAGGVAEADFIAKFSGGSWSALGATPLFGSVYAIAISGSDVYAGGSFINAGNDANADSIAKFSGGVWSSLGATSLDDDVLAITISGSDVYVGGRFANAGGVAEADKIAKFSGGSWSALGATPLSERVQTIVISGTEVYAGGGFLNAGGVAEADYIAVYNDLAPVISSSVRASTNPTSANTVDYTLTFSEPVSGVDASDMGLTTTGTINSAAITNVAGSGATRTVTINTGVGQGTIRLNIFNNLSIEDLTGNPLSGGDFTGGESYTVTRSPIFADVPYSYWANSFIERLYHAGITGGCSTSPLNYCPENTVTRDQMAIFLERGIQGASFVPPNVSPTFGDTAGNFAEDWIEALKNDGITGGCGNGNYCPTSGVTRAQMAIFLERAMHGSSFIPPNVAPTFGDTAGNFAEDWIEALKSDGITSGCGNGNYCPDAVVTRAQMAVFLVKAFNLP